MGKISTQWTQNPLYTRLNSGSQDNRNKNDPKSAGFARVRVAVAESAGAATGGPVRSRAGGGERGAVGRNESPEQTAHFSARN